MLNKGVEWCYIAWFVARMFGRIGQIFSNYRFLKKNNAIISLSQTTHSFGWQYISIDSGKGAVFVQKWTLEEFLS